MNVSQEALNTNIIATTIQASSIFLSIVEINDNESEAAQLLAEEFENLQHNLGFTIEIILAGNDRTEEIESSLVKFRAIAQAFIDIEVL